MKDNSNNMYFSLFNTIKENWFEMLVMTGMMYGILFGVILGLILFGTDEKNNHLEIWYSISLTLVVSGLIVLCVCSAILIFSIKEDEHEKQ